MFQVGDKVRLNEEGRRKWSQNRFTDEGVITRIVSYDYDDYETWVDVTWNNGREYSYPIQHLELIGGEEADTVRTYQPKIGDRVRLNPSSYNYEDYNARQAKGHAGVVQMHTGGDWWRVLWDNEVENSYKARSLMLDESEEASIPFEYQVGDRVVISSNTENYSRYIKQSDGGVGTITHCFGEKNNGFIFRIRWDNGHINTYTEADVIFEDRERAVKMKSVRVKVNGENIGVITADEQHLQEKIDEKVFNIALKGIQITDVQIEEVK